MDVQSRGLILCVFLTGFLILGCDELLDETHVNATDWSSTISVSLAVATLDNDNPVPPPDDTPEPNPDSDKCPCKGSGVITHGDGHKTPCPYHGEDREPAKPGDPHKCKCDTQRTYCNCKEAYGKCSCEAIAANTSTTSRSRLSLLWSRFWVLDNQCD